MSDFNICNTTECGHEWREKWHREASIPFHATMAYMSVGKGELYCILSFMKVNRE